MLHKYRVLTNIGLHALWAPNIERAREIAHETPGVIEALVFPEEKGPYYLRIRDYKALLAKGLEEIQIFEVDRTLGDMEADGHLVTQYCNKPRGDLAIIRVLVRHYLPKDFVTLVDLDDSQFATVVIDNGEFVEIDFKRVVAEVTAPVGYPHKKNGKSRIATQEFYLVDLEPVVNGNAERVIYNEPMEHIDEYGALAIVGDILPDIIERSKKHLDDRDIEYFPGMASVLTIWREGYEDPPEYEPDLEFLGYLDDHILNMAAHLARRLK